MDRTWTLHWLQAAGSLAPWRSRIRAEIDAAFVAISHHMRPPRVDIVIHQIPHWPVAEFGFGGATPSRDTIFLGFDTAHPAMEDRLVGGLRRVVVHEAHHALRQAGPGYGVRLAEVLVSEGLADHFTVEVLGGRPDPWCLSLTSGELVSAARAAEPMLWETNIDLARWFYGDPREKLPWSGYSLGWWLVDRYLAGMPDGGAAALAAVPARDVVARAWQPLIAAPPAAA